MKQALLLPWFPIVLGVGIGGRLLGQARGFGLGALAALFWIVLVQAETGAGIWRDPWQASALACGAAVLVLMGGWSGQVLPEGKSRRAEGTGGSEYVRLREGAEAATCRKMTAALEQFDDWLGRHGADRAAPWPKFGEFIRGVLYETCQATHVRCYRFVEASRELQSLDQEESVQSASISPRPAMAHRVFAEGRSFVTDDTQGSVTEAADCSDRNACWCFPIEKGLSRLGVVEVGQLGSDRPPRAFMAAIEKLISVFWLHLTEVNINRVVGDEDPVSGLLNRPSFLRAADAALREAYDQDEPVALAVVGVQGLRQLNDSGRWEVADELVRSIGESLQTKARMDDRIGRFDGSRFIWLLRRVDSDLAALILRHAICRLEQVCNDRRWGVPTSVYCGLTGSGLGRPELRRLVTTALQQSHRARVEGHGLAAHALSRADGEAVTAGGVTS